MSDGWIRPIRRPNCVHSNPTGVARSKIISRSPAATPPAPFQVEIFHLESDNLLRLFHPNDNRQSGQICFIPPPPLICIFGIHFQWMRLERIGSKLTFISQLKNKWKRKKKMGKCVELCFCDWLIHSIWILLPWDFARFRLRFHL